MKTWIKGGTIITPLLSLENSLVIIEDGKIKAVQPIDLSLEIPDDVNLLDATGLLILPGLLDIHIHGSMGADTMDATPQSLETISSFIIQHGVTSFYPTTGTQSNAMISAAIENVRRQMHHLSGAEVLGVHLEGPYLSENYRGAQTVEWLRNPDPDEYLPWFETGVIRHMTIAPELPGVLDLIHTGLKHGVQFSAGHTEASPQHIQSAVEEGLAFSTHTFNGMAGLHHRKVGTVGAILANDHIFCEIIADGIHVHPDVVKILVKVKGPDKAILVTDAIRATGMPNGEYDLLGNTIYVNEGIARTKAGGLAGSTLTLEKAINNIQQFTGISLNEAVRMATLNPATALGYQGKKGQITPGADADILICDKQLNVDTVIKNGSIVYSKN